MLKGPNTEPYDQSTLMTRARAAVSAVPVLTVGVAEVYPGCGGVWCSAGTDTTPLHQTYTYSLTVY